MESAFTGYLDAVAVCDLPGNGKAQAASIFVLFRIICIKALEDIRDIFRRDTVTVICK